MIAPRRHTAATAARWVLEAVPILLLFDPLRHVLESRMLFHMMVEFPLLLAAGWSFGKRLRRGADAIDAHGLLGITLASAVAAFWMIPAALDASLLWMPVQVAKLATWWLAGSLLARSYLSRQWCSSSATLPGWWQPWAFCTNRRAAGYASTTSSMISNSPLTHWLRSVCCWAAWPSFTPFKERKQWISGRAVDVPGSGVSL
jgi:hypothetical protein